MSQAEAPPEQEAPEGQPSGGLAPEAQQIVETLQASKKKIQQAVGQLKALHAQHKGAASPKSGEIILAVEGLYAALELQQALANMFNDYVFTTALQNTHRMNSLIGVLTDAGVVTDEALRAKTEELVELAKQRSAEQQKAAFDDAIAPEAEGEDDEPSSNIIQMP